MVRAFMQTSPYPIFPLFLCVGTDGNPQERHTDEVEEVGTARRSYVGTYSA
jgi:hypothetical protein